MAFGADAWMIAEGSQLLRLADHRHLVDPVLEDLRLGRAVFTTARVDGRWVVWPEAHAGRLARDAAAIGAPELAVQATTQQLRLGGLAAEDEHGPEHVLRAVATASGALLVRSAAPPPLPGTLTATTVAGGRRPAAIKSVSWAWSDEATRRATAAGSDVALLVDGSDVLEFAAANVVVVTDGVARTPPADGRLLPGLTRAVLLEHDPTIVEAPVSRDEAREADEVVLLSALRGAVPIIALDGKPVADGAPGPWARHAAELLEERGLRRGWPAA